MRLGKGSQGGRQERIVELDGVRAVAVTAVFLHHAFGLKLMWMGVDLFFVLSGFLITGILIENKHRPLREYLGSFYERRVRRIVPPYLLLLLVTTLLFGVAWMRYAYLYVMLMNVLRALSLERPRTLEALWSLAVEEQFYLVWPFVVYVLGEAALGWTAAALVVVVPLLRWAATPLFATHWPIFSLTPFRMDLLLAGALLALAWVHHRERILRWGQYGLALPAVAVAVLVWLSRRHGLTTFDNTPLANVVIYEAGLIASVGVMLWALGGRWAGILRLRPVVYLGRISYTVYLIHITALELAARAFHHRGVVATVGAALTLVYAAASWRWMELPLLGWRPKEPSAVLEAESQARA